MENIAKKLETLGIVGKEAEIYLELLKLKESPLTNLAKAANIKRTSVYYCLDALIKKGLVGIIVKNNKKLYFPEEPKDGLGGLVQQQKSAVEELLPQLKDIYGKGSSLPAIKIYYNATGIRSVFEDVLYCKEKIGRYYVSDFSIDEMLGDAFLKSFVKKRISTGIKSLSMRTSSYAPQRETELQASKQLRETKIMPEGVNFSPYMCIYDNKTVVISAKEKMGFIIESQEFATAQKTIFDTIWNISKSTIQNDNKLTTDGAQKATEEDIYY
ncbi:MAG: helix-turn-helix domain-containing protein [bacterium]